MSAEAHKVCGYLQRKAKGKLLSPWRRWYCVLNGRILIFYRNETDYYKLNSFNDVIDLGLVYSVDRAPGLDFGILLSTHNGPLWLRTRDPLSCSMWLESLQAAIVLRTPKEVLTQPGFNFDLKPEQNGAKEIKSSTGRTSLASRLFRFSLDLIPGHNYSTLDGRKVRESSYNDITVPATEKLPRRAGYRDKQTHSMTASVSNFLLMTSPDEGQQNLLSVPSRAGRQAKGISLSPRLPKSTIVTKLTSFAEQNSEPSTPCKDDNTEPDFQATADTSLQSNSGSNKAAKNPVDENTDCKPVNDTAKEQKSLEKQAGKKENSRKTPRRKSSLALLKSFFFPGKQSKAPVQDEKEESPKKAVQETFSPIQRDTDKPSETQPVVPALEYTEKDIEIGLERSGEEEPKPVVQNSASVIAVIEGPVEEQPVNQLMQEVFTWVQRMPVPETTDFLNGEAASRKRSSTDCRPALPLKLRQRFPSPPYDVPKSPRPISAPSTLSQPTVNDTPPNDDQLVTGKETEIGTRDAVQETKSVISCNDVETVEKMAGKSEYDIEKDRNDLDDLDEMKTADVPAVSTQEAEPESSEEEQETNPPKVVELTTTQVVTDIDEVPCSPAGLEKAKGIRDLVRFFDSQSEQDAEGLLTAADLSQIALNRLSYASSDIVIVEEETVQEAVALLDA